MKKVVRSTQGKKPRKKTQSVSPYSLQYQYSELPEAFPQVNWKQIKALPSAAPRAGSTRDIKSPTTLPTADVFIQAGHQNAPQGKPLGASGPYGAERDWTPVVADTATEILRNYGVSVIREDASLLRDSRHDERFKTAVAVFLHFDGDKESGVELGASVGYKDSSDQPAATAWKKLYSKYWPFKWEDDNYTSNLSGYYGYRFTITTDAEFLIEFGDCETEQQARWLKPRLKWLGALLAHFLSSRIGKGNVPLPPAPSEDSFPFADSNSDPLPFVPASGLPKALPDYAVGLLDRTAGLPWEKAAAMPQVDAYSGAYPGGFYIFNGLKNMPLGVSSALFYQSKLAIDNDGSGGNSAGDPAHQSATTLRNANGVSFNASKDSFAVIPLDRDEAAAAHASSPQIALKKVGLPDFGDTLGLRMGDLGIAFWRRGKNGPIRSVAYFYADKGPANKLGEGSCKMAESLDINPDPNVGGLDADEIISLKKGVIHVAFPGSGAQFLVSNNRNRTTLDNTMVKQQVDLLWQAFLANHATPGI